MPQCVIYSPIWRFVPQSLSCKGPIVLPHCQKKSLEFGRPHQTHSIYFLTFFTNSFNPNVLVTIALALSAMCIIAIPLSRIFVILLLLAGIFGGCFGATDTFTTVQLIRMYGKQVRCLFLAKHSRFSGLFPHQQRLCLSQPSLTSTSVSRIEGEKISQRGWNAACTP